MKMNIGLPREVAITRVARIAHAANEELQYVLGEDIVPFEKARTSAESGVEAVLSGATPEELHEKWVKFKEADGWVWGERKDFVKKTHPCLRPYKDLPEEQRKKDHLFRTVILAVAPFFGLQDR